MRTKKVRGHRRLQKQIDLFFENILLQPLSFDYDYDYVKFRIWPWSGFTYNRISKPAEPKGKTRQKIIKGFLDIYEHWQHQVKQLDEPSELELWLHVPYVTKSQIVFSFRSRLDFYQGTFFKPEKAPKFSISKFKSLEERLIRFEWTYALDEETYDETTVGEATSYKSFKDYEDHKTWFNRKMKQPHRTTPLKKPSSDCSEFYSFKIGDVWLGKKNIG